MVYIYVCVCAGFLHVTWLAADACCSGLWVARGDVGVASAGGVTVTVCGVVVGHGRGMRGGAGRGEDGSRPPVGRSMVVRVGGRGRDQGTSM